MSLETSLPEGSISQIDKALTVSAGIATRNADLATRWIDPERFIQHNPQSADGAEGLREFVSALPGDEGPYDVVRIFEDGEYVWTHSRGEIFGPKVFFDVFRFENGLIVEHWDNLAPQAPPNRSGRSAVDGQAQVQDRELTQENRKLVTTFVETAFLAGRLDLIDPFFDGDALIQHNEHGADGVSSLKSMIADREANGRPIKVDRIERVLADGNFVLLMLSVTTTDGPAALYELFRVADHRIAEHWDVIEPIAPAQERRNTNGKF